jgi:hypothetical protein
MRKLQGVGRFTYGAGSIVDTAELWDYTCNLGRHRREHSNELLRLVIAMRLEKSTMMKDREEAFKKARAGLMGVVDELVYAQMMMQGRLLEARYLRQSELVKDKTLVEVDVMKRKSSGMYFRGTP